MLITKYKIMLENYIEENRLLKFAIVAIAISNIILGMYAYRAAKYQKTVIIPATGNETSIVIYGDEVNDEYVKLFSRHIMNLLFTYTPYSFKLNAEEMLKFCTPAYYNTMRARLKEMEDTITQMGLTSAFYPRAIRVNRIAKSIEIEGLYTQTAQRANIEQKIKTYVIEYVIESGRFLVNQIREKS
jgi:conjugal transfer pilus assembly protein TraE